MLCQSVKEEKGKILEHLKFAEEYIDKLEN